jgi:VWFA-related protein
VDPRPSTTAPNVAAASTDPTFSSSVRVVNVFATVRDQNGKIVKDLNKQDFTLSEEGRPQTIGYFARESNLPLTIGLLLDTSGSTRRVLPDEKTSARHFIEKVLRESQDQAFVIHFDHEVELLQDVTSSRAKLERALDEVEPSQRGGYPDQSSGNTPGGGGGGWPGRSGGRGGRGGGQSHGGGGTLLFDAVSLASKEVMRPQTGRKALILLSDGGDRGSKTTMTAAVEAAQRADTLIYSVFFKGEQPITYGRRGGGSATDNEIDVGKNAMKWMAHQTGGSFFIVTEDRPVDHAFAQIEEELRNQYSLGYTSDSTSTSKDFRRITVDTRRPELVVHARTGYYPA